MVCCSKPSIQYISAHAEFAAKLKMLAEWILITFNIVSDMCSELLSCTLWLAHRLHPLVSYPKHFAAFFISAALLAKLALTVQCVQAQAKLMQPLHSALTRILKLIPDMVCKGMQC